MRTYYAYLFIYFFFISKIFFSQAYPPARRPAYPPARVDLLRCVCVRPANTNTVRKREKSFNGAAARPVPILFLSRGQTSDGLMSDGCSHKLLTSVLRTVKRVNDFSADVSKTTSSTSFRLTFFDDLNIQFNIIQHTVLVGSINGFYG